MIISSALHDHILVPEQGVGVELCSWVEPEGNALLASAYAFGENICLKNVGLA